jgi:hypothetical protein
MSGFDDEGETIRCGANRRAPLMNNSLPRICRFLRSTDAQWLEMQPEYAQATSSPISLVSTGIYQLNNPPSPVVLGPQCTLVP